MQNNDVEDLRPNWIKNNEVSQGIQEYNRHFYPYTVLKKELVPKLPGFVGYPEGTHLFISEEVPEEFRAFVLIHEIIEFTVLKGVKGRCLKALGKELEFIPSNLKAKYTEYRKNFFENLVSFYKETEDDNLKDFKDEIQASFEELEKQAKTFVSK